MNKPFVPFDKFERGCLPPSKTLHETMQESPKTKFSPTPEPCQPTCVPYWQRTGEQHCGEDGVMQVEEANGCGDTRLVRIPERVVWTDTDNTQCDEERNILRRQQVNQCGQQRWVNTSELCCYPNWVETGNIFCDGSLLQREEEDGCGNVRRRSTGMPVNWVATGETRCDPGDHYMVEQESECGDIRWVEILGGCPCIPDWQPSGPERCTNEFVERQEVDGCGHTRWQATGTAVIWTNTGETRCNGGFVQNQQINQCGTTRWLTTETVCVNSPAPIESGNYEMDRCLSDSGVATWREFNVTVDATTGNVTTQGQSSPPLITVPWISGAFNRNDFEARISWSSLQPADSNRLYGGVANGVWQDLGEVSQLVANFRAEQFGNMSLSWDQVNIRIDIRRKGHPIEGGVAFGPLNFRLNLDC